MATPYTQLIPASELGVGQAAAIRNEIIKRILADAARILNLQPDRMIVRDIRVKEDLVVYSEASDADIEDWSVLTGTTADVYETMATGSAGDQRWIGIYGVKGDIDRMPVTALKFNVGGGDRAIWQLQCLKEQDDMVGFSPAGVLIPQNTIYTISRYVRSVSAACFIALKGVVVEPRGLVLSP